jgi:hypothetical protein
MILVMRLEREDGRGIIERDQHSLGAIRLPLHGQLQPDDAFAATAIATATGTATATATATAKRESTRHSWDPTSPTGDRRHDRWFFHHHAS